MYEPLANQMGLAFALVHSLEWLKKAGWFPWLSAHSANVNRAVSLIAAAITSLGITFSVVGNWSAGGTITIQVPPASAILEAVARFALQAGAQHGIYRLTVEAKKEPERL